MPDVGVLADMPAFFRVARSRGPLVLVSPGRMFVELGVRPEVYRGQPEIDGIVYATTPLNVTVIANNAFVARPNERGQEYVPFFGFMVGVACAGHSVVLFEGHPTAFAAGVRGADVLWVDAAMVPFLQSDWRAVAHAELAPGATLIVWDGAPQVHVRSGADWVGTERPGPRSYVNAALTLLGYHAGPAPTLTVRPGEVAPLDAIAPPAEREWAQRLPFRYAHMSGERVVAAFLDAFGGQGAAEMTLMTPAGPRPVRFELGRLADGGLELRRLA